jgi:hypothetical protein
VQHFPKSLSEAIVKQTVPHMHLFTPHDITKIVLSHARAGLPHRPLFTQAAKHVLHLGMSADGFDHGLGEFYHSLIWSFGSVGFSVPPLFQAIARGTVRNVEGLTAQQLYWLASSFTMVPSDEGDDIQRMFDAIAKEVHVFFHVMAGGCDCLMICDFANSL